MLFVKPLFPLPPLDPTVRRAAFRFWVRAPLVQGLPLLGTLPRALARVGRILFGRHELRSQLHEVVGVALVMPEVHVVDLAVPAVAAEPVDLKAARPALEGRALLLRAADAQLCRKPVVGVGLHTRTSAAPVVVLAI